MQTRFFRCIDCGTIVPVQADFWIKGITGDIVTSTGRAIHYDDPTIEERCCADCLQARFEKLMKELKPVGEFYEQSQIGQNEGHHDE